MKRNARLLAQRMLNVRKHSIQRDPTLLAAATSLDVCFCHGVNRAGNRLSDGGHEVAKAEMLALTVLTPMARRQRALGARVAVKVGALLIRAWRRAHGANVAADFNIEKWNG